MCDVNETTPDGPALRSQAPARGDGWHVRVGRCATFLWLERRLRRAVQHARKSTRLRHISNLRTPNELRWGVSARDVSAQASSGGRKLRSSSAVTVSFLQQGWVHTGSCAFMSQGRRVKSKGWRSRPRSNGSCKKTLGAIAIEERYAEA